MSQDHTPKTDAAGVLSFVLPDRPDDVIAIALGPDALAAVLTVIMAEGDLVPLGAYQATDDAPAVTGGKRVPTHTAARDEALHTGMYL